MNRLVLVDDGRKAWTMHDRHVNRRRKEDRHLRNEERARLALDNWSESIAHRVEIMEKGGAISVLHHAVAALDESKRSKVEEGSSLIFIMNAAATMKAMRLALPEWERGVKVRAFPTDDDVSCIVAAINIITENNAFFVPDSTRDGQTIREVEAYLKAAGKAIARKIVKEEGK